MAIITEVRELVDQLALSDALRVEAAELPAAIDRLDNDHLLDLVSSVSSIAAIVERIRVVGAGVIARRSSREAGRSGLAATKGHRNPVDFVQSLSGGTRAEAQRQIRLGTAVMDAAAPPEAAPALDRLLLGLDPAGAVVDVPDARRWDADLCAALLEGELPAAKHDAILRGLGQPPISDGEERASDAVAEVWSIAAGQLIAESSDMAAEEVSTRARAVRDALDPIGAEERFAARFEKRSFRMWTDADGQKHGHFVFDDEGAAWIRSIIDSALRPRRGGPRFIAEDEKVAAQKLVDDPRSNDQLAYDLVFSLVRSGALADAKDVFGQRQPGVRMVVVKDAVGPRDAFGRTLAVGNFEDRGGAVPSSVIERALCTTGAVEVTVDSCGNPLDLGRTQRLFSSRQNTAMAVRDGGCIGPGCNAPPSQCESHHLDGWASGGRTDIDRGVLLCRFHHMWVHNFGWRITRDGKGPFILHPPPGQGDPIALRSKSPLKWAWDTPAPPSRPSWRTPAPAPHPPVPVPALV